MAVKPLKVWNGSSWDLVGLSSGANVIYSPDAPSTPATGDVWIDSDGETSQLNANDFLTNASASATYATKASVEGNLTSPYLLMGA